MIRFASVVSLLFVYTCYKALQLSPAHPLQGIGTAAALMLMMVGWLVVTRFDPNERESALHRLWTWAAVLSMGFWATFILLSLPIDALHLGYAGFAAGTHRPQLTVETQALVVRAILALSFALAFVGFFQARRGPKVRQVDVPIKNLHASLEGFTIAQISDLHVGPTIRQRYVEKMVKSVNRCEADFIAITGDLADATAVSITEELEPLRALRSNLGTYYVTGNHEYYWDAPGLVSKARELGITPLLNENRLVRKGEATIAVAGVNDPMGSPDIKKAAEGMGNAALKVLLAHRPDASTEAEPAGFDLQLSGHTHAGQFFPFSMLIGLAHDYTRGLNRHGRMWVYVNPGTGYWGPPNRLGITPEITLLKLSRS